MNTEVRHPSKSEVRHRHCGRFIDDPKKYREDIDPRLIFEKQEGLCALCHEPIHDKYELDHDWPVFFGGYHEMNNLQCVHPTCHQVKNQAEHKCRAIYKDMVRVETKVGLAWIDTMIFNPLKEKAQRK